MTQNMADEIRNCEAAAKKTVADAKNEAARILAVARTSAEQSVKEAKQKSHRFFREQVKAAEAEADIAAIRTVEAGRREAKEFYDSNKPRTIYVADWLVKEVMAAYGNSTDAKNTRSSA